MGRKLIKKYFRKDSNEHNTEKQTKKYLIKLLYQQLIKFYGKDKFRTIAENKKVLALLKARELEKNVTALEKIIFDKTDKKMENQDISKRLTRIKEKIGEMVARAQARKNIEDEINKRLEKHHQQYIKKIKKEIVSEDKRDNINTFKKLIKLDKMESISLNRSSLERVRPSSLDEIIGQDQAITALMSKVASPYPQHVILYGPPGVGKTTAARLALQEAKKMEDPPFYEESSFVEVDGATLRWDPREMTNSLLGSVHDPIYQGAKKGLAEDGVPEPKTGLVTEAHGGILFIDEIGELDSMLQNKLLKVMEDKRVTFESSYYDTNAEDIPLYIKKLFEEGAPADFILIGATTQSPKNINPAFRSRATEVYFNPLNKRDIKKILVKAAQKLNVNLVSEIPAIISKYTIEARKAINLLLDAYSLALYNEGKFKGNTIKKEVVYKAIKNRRMSPNQQVKVSASSEIGRVFGLGVRGFLGSIIEIEAVAFNAEKAGKGQLRFNETAGSMTRDSFFNAASVVRKITGESLKNYDIHVNLIGGGNIDGPSAGIAILMAIISAIKKIPLKQNIAMTGEVSIQGKIKSVGGLKEKVYAADQASMKRVIIPETNSNQVKENTEIDIIPISSINQALEILAQK